MNLRKKEYETVRTKATHDSGKDISKSKKNVYGEEYVYIECKKSVGTAFAYIVLNEKVHRGAI